MSKMQKTANCYPVYSLAVDNDRAVLCLRVLVHHLPHSPAELKQGVAEGI